MQTVTVFALALICVFGVALGQFGFPGQTAVGGGGGGLGSGGLLGLLGLLFFFLLFSNSSSSGTGSTTVIFGNFSK